MLLGSAVQATAGSYLSQATVAGSFTAGSFKRSRTQSQEETLKPMPSGIFVFKADADALVPIEEEISQAILKTAPGRKTKVLLNNIFAKAYFGGKVWEGELTAKPQDGTGFFKYISPEGRVVFFPICWTFESCPEAFCLATVADEEELGVEVSYYNVYTSIAEMANTAKCKSYFRVYPTGEGDRTQTAQMIVFSEDRVGLQPEVIADNTTGVTVSVSTIAAVSSEPNANGLKNLTPEYVEVIKLASGQAIARDASKWATQKTNPAARRGKLPPIFVN